MGTDDDELMAEMAAETKAITEAEAERSKAIDNAEQAARAVIEAYKDK